MDSLKAYLAHINCPVCRESRAVAAKYDLNPAYSFVYYYLARMFPGRFVDAAEGVAKS